MDRGLTAVTTGLVSCSDSVAERTEKHGLGTGGEDGGGVDLVDLVSSWSHTTKKKRFF